MIASQSFPQRAAQWLAFGSAVAILFSIAASQILLALTWAACGSIAAGWGIVQFLQNLQQAKAANSDDYSFYVGERITGFMSHWNTFSAQEMFALIMIGAFVLFAPNVKRRILWIGVAGL